MGGSHNLIKDNLILYKDCCNLFKENVNLNKDCSNLT